MNRGRSFPGLARPRRLAPMRGLTLVELLLATIIAAGLLLAGWSWLWSTAGVVARADDRAQASTGASFALRAIASDLDEGMGLAAPPAGRSWADSLSVRAIDVATGAPTVTLIAWDRVREVLWRKTSSTYLADHVTAFAVEYLDVAGTPLAQLPASALDASVVRVRVTVSVDTPSGPVTRSLDFLVPRAAR